ncbi:hypothetical protein CDL15_Pgr018601 [Punica granatum]|nr:hypothetical protein CDL15_Pgr018601 [Punica granatum]
MKIKWSSSPKMTEEEATAEQLTRAGWLYHELGLRLAALGLTLAAAVVVGVDKETEVVSVSIASSLPPLRVPVTAKWNYMSSIV